MRRPRGRRGAKRHTGPRPPAGAAGKARHEAAEELAAEPVNSRCLQIGDFRGKPPGEVPHVSFHVFELLRLSFNLVAGRLRD